MHFFDERIKMSYIKGCEHLFNASPTQNIQYPSYFPEIDEFTYRSELIAISMAYLDSKPRELSIGSTNTFGADMLNYGAANGTVLAKNHPIEANFKTSFLPACQQKYHCYSWAVMNKIGRRFNASSLTILALELLKNNQIKPDNGRIALITQDIRTTFGMIDSIISKYRFI